MQHLLTPYSRKIEPFAWWDGAFNDQELDWLQERTKQASDEGLLNGDSLNNSVRRTKVNWLYSDPETKWVYEKLSHVVARLNADVFGFDLTGFGEPLQLTHYLSSNQGEYKWHQDFGSQGPSRKLSLVMQLSDPGSYEGGALQLFSSGKPATLEKKRGLIYAFPSWAVHQVTPVTKGTRQTLVTWITGPEFK